MKQETQNKFAAILAAAQAKAADQTAPKFSEPQPTPSPIKQPETPAEPPKKAKMVSFTIMWQEGSGKYDGKIFTTWQTANDAMTNIYREHSGQGYLKVKINVKWENGAEITDRADCSDHSGDFCPKRETIGQFLGRHNSVMYASNLNKGDRVNLSFEDEYMNLEQLQAATIPEFLASPNFINDAALDEQPGQDKPELSEITISDLLNEPKATIQIVDYSDRAFAVIGDTKPIKDVLFSLGGKFNRFLTCGAGWIFSKKHLQTVKAKLSL